MITTISVQYSEGVTYITTMIVLMKYILTTLTPVTIITRITRANEIIVLNLAYAVTTAWFTRTIIFEIKKSGKYQFLKHAYIVLKYVGLSKIAMTEHDHDVRN